MRCGSVLVDGSSEVPALQGDLVEYSVKETDRGPQTASVYIKVSHRSRSVPLMPVPLRLQVSQDPALNQRDRTE